MLALAEETRDPTIPFLQPFRQAAMSWMSIYSDYNPCESLVSRILAKTASTCRQQTSALIVTPNCIARNYIAAYEIAFEQLTKYVTGG